MTGMEPLILLGAAGGMQAASSIMGGISANNAAQAQAKQLKQNAMAAEAASQRKAIQSRHEADMVASKTLAGAAASGGGASDPTVANIIGDIQQRGEYNAAMDLYNGTEKARGLRDQATAVGNEGRQKLISGIMGGVGAGFQTGYDIMKPPPTIMLSGGKSMYGKYGDPLDELRN